MKEKMKKVSGYIYELPKEGKMLVPGRIFASDKIMKATEEGAIAQVANVAQLSGIVGHSIALMDLHWGYGFCIGGVAGFDAKSGIISPGGVGYDIGCGVRLLATNFTEKEFMPKREQVISDLYKTIPSGTGKGGFKLSAKELDEILNQGVNWAVKNNYASKEDLEHTEDYGKIQDADASKVSQRAKARGINQLGSLGSGNHFLEIQKVETIFNKEVAKAFGLKENQIVILIHCGSRGLGHQAASDYIKLMEDEYGWKNLPDRQLINAPINSKLGKDYRAAMAAAANFAFTNRQMISFHIRQVFKKYFPKSELNLVYDIAHNIAKFEKFNIEGKEIELCIHRKGATRSLGPGRKELPEIYQKTGQPIFLPGSMGTFSYVLVGTNKAQDISFASTAHGAGRVMSRSKAIHDLPVEHVKKVLAKRDVILIAGSKKGIAEEAPEAYKDVDEVARVSNELGIGNLVARLKPLAVMKG